MRYGLVICDRDPETEKWAEVRRVANVTLTAAWRESDRAMRRGLRVHGGQIVQDRWGARVSHAQMDFPTRRMSNIYVHTPRSKR